MHFPVKMSGQPSSYDQPFSRYRKLSFLPLFAPFWPKKWGLYAEFGLGLFFGENPSYKDVKNGYIAFFQIYSGLT